MTTHLRPRAVALKLSGLADGLGRLPGNSAPVPWSPGSGKVCRLHVTCVCATVESQALGSGWGLSPLLSSVSSAVIAHRPGAAGRHCVFPSGGPRQ